MAKKIEIPVIYVPPEKKYFILKRTAIKIYPVPYEITEFEKQSLKLSINNLKNASRTKF
jgi:hypothetical protein